MHRHRLMDTKSRAQLAVRTVVVSTRAAVGANLAIGRTDLAHESARRGLDLLADLRERAVQAGAADAWDEGDRHLASLAEAPTVAISVEAEAEPLLPRTGPRSNGARSEAR